MFEVTIQPSRREVNSDNAQVSVVIPCYDQADRLEHALTSVFAQHVTCEVLVVDDGSRTDQAALIQLTGHRFGVRVLRLETSHGPAAARNLGIDAGRARFIAFLDSDDVWLPGKLQLQLAQMKSRGLGFTYTKYGNVNLDGLRVMPAPYELSRRDLLRNTAIGCSTVMLCREFMGKIRFPKAQVEDLAYWAALLGGTRKAYLVGGDVYVHRHLGGRSANKFNAAWRYWRTLRDTLNIPAYEAATNFVPYTFRAAYKHWMLPKNTQETSRAVAGHP